MTIIEAATPTPRITYRIQERLEAVIFGVVVMVTRDAVEANTVVEPKPTSPVGRVVVVSNG